MPELDTRCDTRALLDYQVTWSLQVVDILLLWKVKKVTELHNIFPIFADA